MAPKSAVLSWLKNVLRDRSQFLIPMANIPLPACHARPVREEDFAACEEIYRLNEIPHFPENFFATFAKWLRGDDRLVLVLEIDGQVRALAGISTVGDTEVVALSYGMVHPEYQRQGLGTALLLTRIAVLPEPVYRWILVLSATGGSHTFFERFSFRFAGRFPSESGMLFDCYRSHVYQEDWRRCRAAIANSAVALEADGITVPSMPVATAATPDTPS
jgi:ribosomal protein S18 acetylase RimI-like enzyme